MWGRKGQEDPLQLGRIEASLLSVQRYLLRYHLVFSFTHSNVLCLLERVGH